MYPPPITTISELISFDNFFKLEKYNKSNGACSKTGLYCYNFSLTTDPFKLQPNGAFNTNLFKTIEFEYAHAGIACIETTYSTINHLFPKLKDEAIANLLSNHARQIFNLGSSSIQEGQKVELTLFNRANSVTPTKAGSKSKSVNNPFFDKALKGTVLGTYSKGQLHLNQSNS